jgi:hypothetical protein
MSVHLAIPADMEQPITCLCDPRVEQSSQLALSMPVAVAVENAESLAGALQQIMQARKGQVRVDVGSGGGGGGEGPAKQLSNMSCLTLLLLHVWLAAVSRVWMSYHALR